MHFGELIAFAILVCLGLFGLFMSFGLWTWGLVSFVNWITG